MNLSKYRLNKELLIIFDHLTDEQKIEKAIQKYPVKDVKNIFTYYELEQYSYAKKLILDKYKNSPQDLFRYARYMICGRWLEAEPIIMTSPQYAYFYSRDVIKGRWPEAEPIIVTCPEHAYFYSRDVIQGRWLEAEPTIMTNVEYIYCYSRNVIKGRWPEAEPALMKRAFLWQLYKDRLNL